MRLPLILFFLATSVGWFFANDAASSSPILEQGPHNGLVFSGIQACPGHRHITFEVSAFNGLPADTLCSEVTTGRLLWCGGPIRGLSTLNDTVYAASLLGFHSLTPNDTLFTPWDQPQGGVLKDWLPHPRAVPAQHITREQPFPERYLKLEETAVFLVDAEHPPNWDSRWNDLHLRTADGTEWLAARNLAIYDWVLNQDKTHWALVARAWVPDYGGQEKYVLMAGVGDRVERFDMDPLEYCTWDTENRLWAVTVKGQLVKIEPQENAWKRTTQSLAEHRCSLKPSASDSVWTWVWPDSFPAYNTARSFAARHGQGWVAKTDDIYWACWTGFQNHQDLLRSWPDAPVEGGAPQSMAIRDSDFLGTAKHFRSAALEGEVSLMHVLKHDVRLSELWWRYPGQRRVRLAGPWPIAGTVQN